MAPSNSMEKYLPLSAAGTVKCLRYQPVPEMGRPPVWGPILDVEGSFDGPIVRQIERAPGAVVEARLSAPRRRLSRISNRCRRRPAVRHRRQPAAGASSASASTDPRTARKDMDRMEFNL